jgi:hypothetical protein
MRRFVVLAYNLTRVMNIMGIHGPRSEHRQSRLASALNYAFAARRFDTAKTHLRHRSCDYCFPNRLLNAIPTAANPCCNRTIASQVA